MCLHTDVCTKCMPSLQSDFSWAMLVNEVHWKSEEHLKMTCSEHLFSPTSPEGWSSLWELWSPVHSCPASSTPPEDSRYNGTEKPQFRKHKIWIIKKIIKNIAHKNPSSLK